MMLVLALYRKLVALWGARYRPELHYMRGPGPKWLERQREAFRRARRSE
jgi:hypothetical protein